LLLGADLAAIPHIKGGKGSAACGEHGEAQQPASGSPDHGRSGGFGGGCPLWFGIWAPAGTPANIVAKISADTRKGARGSVRARKTRQPRNDTMDMSPEEFARFVRSELIEYARVIKAAGIKPQ